MSPHRLTASLRTVARAARARLGPGAAGGALAMAALFACELALAGGLQMMGVHDEGIERVLRGRFTRPILLQQSAVLVVYLVLGGLFGLLADGILRSWAWARHAVATPGRRLLAGFTGALAIEGWRLVVAIIRYPQLFDEPLYARGGAPRAFQRALTDHLPLAVAEAAGWALLVAALLLPLASARAREPLARGLRRVSRRLRLVLGVAGGALLVGLGALFGGRSIAQPATTAPNVLLIAVDSLRADRVGPGHESVAPRLAAFAASGVRFESAYVTVPRTFPSWVTLLSGRFPHHHGLRHMFPDHATRAAAGPLLPSRFAAQGYATTVVSDFSGEIFSRLDAGFQHRDVPYFDLRTIVEQAGLNLHPALVPWARTALGERVAPSLAAAADNADPERLTDRVIAALHRDARRGPFFLTAFYSAPHFPYAAPDPYYRRFTDPTYDGPFRYQKPVAALGARGQTVGPRDEQQVRGLYDGAVAAVDTAIGRLLDELDRSGLAERTLVVLLADHGEQLFDDGHGMGHGEHLHGDKVLHIPLVIRDPRRHLAAHAVPGIVRDVDLAPTLAALSGVPIGDTDGVDLGPLLRGERRSLDLAAYAESGLWLTPEGPHFGPRERLPYPALPELVTVEPDDDIVLSPALRDLVIVAKHRALRTERWKLVYAPTRSGVVWTLYDLAADPGERVDVAPQQPEVVAALKARLYAWMTADGSTVEGGFVLPPVAP